MAITCRNSRGCSYTLHHLLLLRSPGTLECSLLFLRLLQLRRAPCLHSLPRFFLRFCIAWFAPRWRYTALCRAMGASAVGSTTARRSRCTVAPEQRASRRAALLRGAPSATVAATTVIHCVFDGLAPAAAGAESRGLDTKVPTDGDASDSSRAVRRGAFVTTVLISLL